jgi:hypothetical protein
VCRTADRYGAAGREGAVFLRTVHRSIHLQLRLRREPYDRQRRRIVPARRAAMERRQTWTRHLDHPVRDRASVRDRSHAAVQSGRYRERQANPEGLYRPDAVSVSRPADADVAAADRLCETADAGRAADVARLLQGS